MKNIVFTFLLLIIVSNLKAQFQEKKGNIGASIGPSIPFGDLASKNTQNEKAGFANIGLSYDFSIAYRLGNSKLGITALLRGHSMPFDDSSFKNELTYMTQGLNIEVESSNWTLGGLFLGGFGSFPISDKAFFEARAMLGYVSAKYPSLNVKITAPGSSGWVKQSGSSTNTIGALLGGGFKFEAHNNVYILTNIDYVSANPEFTKIEVTTSFGDRNRFSQKQNMKLINLSAGLAFKI